MTVQSYQSPRQGFHVPPTGSHTHVYYDFAGANVFFNNSQVQKKLSPGLSKIIRCVSSLGVATSLIALGKACQSETISGKKISGFIAMTGIITTKIAETAKQNLESHPQASEATFTDFLKVSGSVFIQMAWDDLIQYIITAASSYITVSYIASAPTEEVKPEEAKASSDLALQSENPSIEKIDSTPKRTLGLADRIATFFQSILEQIKSVILWSQKKITGS